MILVVAVFLLIFPSQDTLKFNSMLGSGWHDHITATVLGPQSRMKTTLTPTGTH
jgi:hypothetical protein